MFWGLGHFFRDSLNTRKFHNNCHHTSGYCMLKTFICNLSETDFTGNGHRIRSSHHRKTRTCSRNRSSRAASGETVITFKLLRTFHNDLKREISFFLLNRMVHWGKNHSHFSSNLLLLRLPQGQSMWEVKKWGICNWFKSKYLKVKKDITIEKY